MFGDEATGQKELSASKPPPVCKGRTIFKSLGLGLLIGHAGPTSAEAVDSKRHE